MFHLKSRFASDLFDASFIKWSETQSRNTQNHWILYSSAKYFINGILYPVYVFYAMHKCTYPKTLMYKTNYEVEVAFWVGDQLFWKKIPTEQ